MKKVVIFTCVVALGSAFGLTGCRNRAQQAELDRLQAEIKSVKAALEKAGSEQIDLEARIEILTQARDALAKQVNELTGTRDGLQQQLADVQPRTKELQGQLSEMKDQRDVAQLEAEQLATVRSLLRQELDTMAKSRDAAATEGQKAQEQVATLTTQVRAETKKVRELQEQLAAANASAEASGMQAIENPAIHSFATTRPRINAGQSSTLSWRVSNADCVRIEPDIGAVGALGSRTVTPLKTTTYTLIATNPAGESRVTRRIEIF